MNRNPLLQVCGLTVTFATGRVRGASDRGKFRAVNDVSLNLEPGETLALVGESGSGKSTLAHAILGLVSPTEGTILFDGVDVHGASPTARNRVHCGMQLVFQDTGGSLNPRMTVGESIAEPLVIQQKARGAPLRAKVEELLEVVGLGGLDARRYPHEFSGGQRQRVCIARALALGPRIIVCDEPVSALDVSVQAQILNLLIRLQCESGLAYLFITHDLGLVRHFSDRIAVMRQGRIVESGPTGDVMLAPQHEYTRTLLASAASLVPRRAAKPAT